MAANLKSRLARIRSLGLAKASELAKQPSSGAEPAPRGRPPFLDTWEKVDEFVWKRVLRYEAPPLDSLDPTVFAALHRGRGKSSRRPAEAADAPDPIAARRLRFFDLETTGLSGGTGTIAFLAALGRIEEDRFALTQLFLEDFPGEGPFIEALLGLFGEDDVIVSYNGKAFDLPLLRTRCVMNALVPPSLPHVDALFASRRLWSRVHGGASLGLLEREVLGRERGEDLPGAMIPEVWLGFARTGESPLMPLVLSHNADDVVALALLAARAQAVFRDPLPQLSRRDVDRSGLGRGLLSVGRCEEGEGLLEAALGDGDEGAGLLLLRRYRAARRTVDAARVAEMLPPTYRSSVERAKFYERLARDLPAAARCAKDAAEFASSDAERAAAAHRLARIERKLSLLVRDAPRG